MRDDLEKQNSQDLHQSLPVDAEILQRLGVLIRDRMGLDYTGDNRADLERGLRRAAGEFHFIGPDAVRRCARWLVSSPLSTAQIEILARHFTIGETYFFRDPSLFETLRLHIWPALLQAKQAAGLRELRIWSAACCTGEEPYSLAMQLHTLLPQMLPDWQMWKITILATDLNPVFLQKAQDAVYSAWSFRAAARDEQKLYFDEISKGRFQLKPEIRRLVEFRPLNLVSDNYPTLLNGTAQQDIIFCRNVLMYFAPEKARMVTSKLICCLNEGGYLVPAASEAAAGLFEPLKILSLPGVILYQKGRNAQPSESIGTVKATAIIEEVPRVSASQVPEPSASLWHEKARLSADLGHLDEALLFCDRAIEEDKEDKSAGYYYLRASILLEKTAAENETSLADEAEVALRRALGLQPDFALAHFVLGNLERRRGHIAAARCSWQNALCLLEKLSPESPLQGGEELNAGHAAALIERALFTLEESISNES